MPMYDIIKSAIDRSVAHRGFASRLTVRDCSRSGIDASVAKAQLADVARGKELLASGDVRYYGADGNREWTVDFAAVTERG